MIKVLVNSDEEYFKYCEEHLLGYMNKGFGTNWADINQSTVYVNCNYKVNLPNWNNKTLEVSFKPFSYPCVMVLEGDEDFHDNTWCNVMFVYQEDFKNK